MFSEYVCLADISETISVLSYCNCSLCLITIYKIAVLILTSQLAAVEVALLNKMRSY